MNNIGSIIKLKRNERNMKQEELCSGICAPSYLSRIENNLVQAEEEIYRLLFKRLGIDYETVIQRNGQIDEQIEKWHENMLMKRKSDENIGELNKISSSAGGEAALKYEIVHCRHLLLSHEIDQAGKILKNLGEIIQPGHTRNFFLYANILMLFYYMKENYRKAVDTGLELMNVTGFESLGKDFEIGVFYYNLALNYKNLYLYERGEYYARRALQIFNEGYYLEQAIDCQILSGICHNNSGQWEEAEKAYLKANRLLRYLPKKIHSKYLSITNNDLGYCYEQQGNYKEAIRYYLQSLRYKRNEDKLITLLNLIRCSYTSGDQNKAKDWLYVALELKNNSTPMKFLIQLDIFRLILFTEQPEMDEISDIQNTAIDFFTENEMWDFTRFYSELFAGLYERRNAYKKANEMYKLSLFANKKILERRNGR